MMLPSRLFPRDFFPYRNRIVTVKAEETAWVLEKDIELKDGGSH